MSRKPENTFIASVHRHLPSMNELYRMKNHNDFNGGIADCWYSGSGADLWVEYKFIVVPKRPDTMIDLVGGKNPTISALQQDWLRGRYNEGRHVWVIVGCKAGGVIFKYLEWERPLPVGEFNDLVSTRSEVARVIATHCT